MIPLRIKLKGFMSYRDEQELTFDGATLWMLAGQNGAGKSAIFDAMTYALYDKHRLGGEDHDELINKERDELLVDFEFRSSDDTYRILRTLSRRNNRATRLAYHISGPHAPNPALQIEQPVPETDSAHGFRDWVRRTIGLDYDAFTASVLLCQGKAESLLNAKPKERHTVLSQILDLAIYERLRLVTEERRTTSHKRAELLHEQFGALAPVTDTELTEAECAVADSKAAREQAQVELLRVAQLKGEAKQWEQLSAEQADLQRALDATNELLAHADEIEQQATRLETLRRVTPLLQSLLEARTRMQENENAIRTHAEEIAQAEGAARAAERILGELTEVAERLGHDHADRMQARGDAQKELLGLHPQLTLIAQIGEQRQQLAAVDEQLRTYPADLDQQRGDLSATVARLEEVTRALPQLEKFASARAQYARAHDTMRATENGLAAIASQIPGALVAEGVSSATLYEQHAHQTVTTANADVKHLRERMERLHAVEGQPTCSYCGQPLTEEHIAAEEQHIEEELAQARATLIDAKAAHARARKLAQEEEQQQEKYREVETEALLAQNRAETAFKSLPEVHRGRVVALSAAAIPDDQQRAYPSADDLAALREETSRLASARDALKAVETKVERRDQQHAVREQLATRLAQFEATCPPDRAKEIVEREREVRRRLEGAERDIEALSEPLAEANTRAEAAGAQVDGLRERVRGLESKRNALTTVRAELERSAREKLAAVPEDWRSQADRLSAERMAVWQAERDSLAGADVRAAELSESRGAHAPRQESLAKVMARLGAIPVEARYPVATLEERERDANARHADALANHETAMNTYRDLTARRHRRTSLEHDALTSRRQAHLYGMLARLLGRDHLQRHLLLQAEAGIVERANSVLERISGGTLRLSLRSPDESTQAGQKALDLVAYNELTVDKPLLVGALSGSQRFRVAVSLALGIGEYASEGNRRIETVIIDEGFGSLDQQGRQEMIGELQSLKSELKRIILVSHQEEFTDKFTRGYHIRLEGGTSKVSDLERTAMEHFAPDVAELGEGDTAVRRTPAPLRP
jgi:exonuclease SbcC